MIRNIFPNSFYSIISTPNKEEIFKALKTARVDREASKWIEWNRDCKVDVEILYRDEIGKLFLPSLEIFLKELGVNQDLPFECIGIWRNTYKKGGFQEIHDHLVGAVPESVSPFYGAEEADLSGCFFLEDYHPEASTFYFHNRHSSELNVVWRKFMSTSPFLEGSLSYNIQPKAGDVIFFPAYMLHGVTPHGSKNPRTTVSFNIKFLT